MLDLTGVENGDIQAENTITLDNGFSTPDNVNFTAEIVSGGSGGGSSFTNTLTVVDNPIPSGISLIPLTMTFYDDYSNTPDKQYTTIYSGKLDAGTNQHVEAIPVSTAQQAVQTIGQVTGTKVHIIENPNDLTQGNWLETATFFDDRLRSTQVQGDNYKGGQDTTINLYNFTGKVLTTYLAHNNPQAGFSNNTRVKTNMNLDPDNRVLQVYTTVNDIDSTRRLVSQETYDPMSQVLKRQLGQLPDSSFLETQDMAYNIRGWLKGINMDYANNDNSHGADNRWFGMELSYDWGFGTNFVNGNISGNKWRSKGDGQQRAYGFGYDDANRFLSAAFNQYSGSGWDKTAGVDFTATMGNGTDPNTAYDANGNILSMQQNAWQLGGSHLIDSLNYTCYNHSNKLLNVIDGDNNPQTTLGDFRTSSLSPYATGKTSAAVDYTYDGNGNLLTDLNKDIGSQSANGIVYNHLNLPWQISFRSATGTKGTITYIYDAVGNKLKKTTLDSIGNLETVTTYIGPFQYQATASLTGTGSGNFIDTLKFFAHTEGRVRVESDTTGGETIASYKYDYFLKDHLGNTRIVLTDEQQTDMYPAATMEYGDSATENLYYSNLDSTRSTLPPGYPTDTTTNPNNYVAKISGNGSGPVIGPGIVLKVMAGDQFSIRVSSWYRLNGTVPGAPVNPLTDILSHLISGMAGVANAENPGLTALQSNSPILSSNVLNFLQDTGTTINSSKPHAFVNWILLDNQFNYVAASSGFSQVGNDQELHKTTLTNLPVTSSGYLYIYTSNETPNVDVFFDNLQVTHTRGPLLEENHYYPFGLSMAGISDRAAKAHFEENRYRYNGKELQNSEFSDGTGLEDYDFGARLQDPQLGRMWGLDPLSIKMQGISPYVYVIDNPILFKDFDGLIPVSIFDTHVNNGFGPGSNYTYYTVRPTIAAFLSGALGLSKDAILNTRWVPGGVPAGYAAITIARTVNFNEADLENNDVISWTETVSHESTHRDDIESQGIFSFYKKYLDDYYDNRVNKQQDQQKGYENIDAEAKAYSNEAEISQFFSDSKNSNDFFSILNNNSLSDTRKSNQLEALGIEKIAIPGLNELSKGLTNKLGTLDETKDAVLMRAINSLINLVNSTIQDDKTKIKKLRL